MGVSYSPTVLTPLVLASTDDPSWITFCIGGCKCWFFTFCPSIYISWHWSFFPLPPFTLHLSIFNLLCYWILSFLYFFFFCFYIFYVKNWLIRKDPDTGKDWRQEKGTTGNKMAGWHHRLDGDEFGWTPGVGDGQGGLACCIHGVTKSRTRLSDWTELNWTEGD